MNKENLLKVNEEITPLLPGEENTLKGGYGIIETDLIPSLLATNGNCALSGGSSDTNGNCGPCSCSGSSTRSYY